MKTFGLKVAAVMVPVIGWTVLLPVHLMQRYVLPHLSTEKRTRLGHLWMYFEVALLPAFVGAMIGADAINRYVPNWLAFVLAIEVICMYFGLVDLSDALRAAHDHNLCEKCIAAFPLDAQEQAHRKRPWLKLWHMLAELGRAGSVVVIVLMAVPAFTMDVMFSVPVCVAILAARGRVVHVHRTLHPVCPFCHHGGGGRDTDTEVAPVPDPVAA